MRLGNYFGKLRTKTNHQTDDGLEYILAKIQIEHLDGNLFYDTSPTIYSDVPTFRFQAFSFDGNLYRCKGKGLKCYPESKIVEVPEPGNSVTVQPGETKEGWGVFLVSEDDQFPMLHYGIGSISLDEFWWKLYED